MWPPGVNGGHYWAVTSFNQPLPFIHRSRQQVHFNLKWILKLFRDHFKLLFFPPDLNELNRKALSDLISNLISFTSVERTFFFFYTFHTLLYVPGHHVNCILQMHPSSSSNSHSSAGVGNALEGGRGRAGTKLFQDFQMLSRIWTHPWCLQLDYISKENRVGWRPFRLNCKKLHYNTWIHTHTHSTGKTAMLTGHAPQVTTHINAATRFSLMHHFYYPQFSTTCM